MEPEDIERLAAKKFAIGRNVGRKEARELQRAEHRRQFREGMRAGQEKERARQAQERRRKGRYRRLLIMTVAFSVTIAKAIEILVEQLTR